MNNSCLVQGHLWRALAAHLKLNTLECPMRIEFLKVELITNARIDFGIKKKILCPSFDYFS